MKTTSTLLRGATLVVALSLSTLLPAQSKPSARNDLAAQNLSRSDRNFLEKAAKSGMEEVEISQVVALRLSNPRVRELAEAMIKDHTAVNTELADLAARKGVTLPADMTKAVEKWSAKAAKDLDKDYLEALQDDHQEAVKLFEKASKSEDAEIAAFAMKHLPSLQQHLQQVNSLKQTVK